MSKTDILWKASCKQIVTVACTCQMSLAVLVFPERELGVYKQVIRWNGHLLPDLAEMRFVVSWETCLGFEKREISQQQSLALKVEYLRQWAASRGI